MSRETIVSVPIGFVVFVFLAMFAPAAHAGPPLICWPFDIGHAQSLPWGGSGWSAAKPDYDLRRLADDTLALLSPSTPVIVRMETLRRATVYAMKDRQVAKELLARLEARTRDAQAQSKPDALAFFDVGYLAEAYKQARWAGQASWGLIIANPAVGLDGYALIRKALALRGQDAEMEFAAAFALVGVVDGRPDADRLAHLQKAVAGAKDGSLLARNLVLKSSLLKVRGSTMAELRASMGAARN